MRNRIGPNSPHDFVNLAGQTKIRPFFETNFSARNLRKINAKQKSVQRD